MFSIHQVEIMWLCKICSSALIIIALVGLVNIFLWYQLMWISKCLFIWTCECLHNYFIIVKANRQWSQLGWMLTHCRDGLWSSSSCLILDNSVGLWMSIQFVADLVSQSSQHRILHSAKGVNLYPFDSKIACLCQSIKINNNRRVRKMHYFRFHIN